MWGRESEGRERERDRGRVHVREEKSLYSHRNMITVV